MILKEVKKYLGNLIGRMTRSVDPKKLALLIYRVVYRLSINRPARESLILLLELERYLYSLTGMESCRYGNGIHSKHRHIGYHNFFLKNIFAGETILDIGCGNGVLAYDMALKGALITAIDKDDDIIRFAKEQFHHPNIQWISGEAPKDIPYRPFQVIVLSNVLEHIENRQSFLKEIQEKVKPKRWLIRVPVYDRDWRVPLMDELGIDYRLDHTHCIEYTDKTFVKELNDCGLVPIYIEKRWGEIWCVAEDVK